MLQLREDRMLGPSAAGFSVQECHWCRSTSLNVAEWYNLRMRRACNWSVGVGGREGGGVHMCMRLGENYYHYRACALELTYKSHCNNNIAETTLLRHK